MWPILFSCCKECHCVSIHISESKCRHSNISFQLLWIYLWVLPFPCRAAVHWQVCPQCQGKSEQICKKRENGSDFHPAHGRNTPLLLCLLWDRPHQQGWTYLHQVHSYLWAPSCLLLSLRLYLAIHRQELTLCWRFTGATGRAFLFNKVVNLKFSEVQDRVMLTGRHMVRWGQELKNLFGIQTETRQGCVLQELWFQTWLDVRVCYRGQPKVGFWFFYAFLKISNPGRSSSCD